MIEINKDLSIIIYNNIIEFNSIKIQAIFIQ